MADMLKTFAEDLKAVREEKNLTLRNISQQTRLSLTILENLESGDFTFQPQAYIRAFLKQYINYLGLDIEETMFEYDLAKNNKYKSKRASFKNPDPVIEKKEPDEPKVTKNKISEQEKIIPDIPTKAAEEKNVGQTPEPEPVKTPETKKESGEIVIEPKNISRPKAETSYNYTKPPQEKKKISLSFLQSPLVRNISLILFAALVLIGLYSLINILFLEGSNSKPEVIRQNFDDVVKEQEKKILGKRTPEEIQDSIRRAELEMPAANDSITLKVTGLTTGIIYLVTDSVDFERPKKIYFEKNEVKVFKAQKKFFISSAKTGSFTASINNAPLNFNSPEISKVKIDRTGVAK